MKEILKDYDFNLTLRFIVVALLFCVLICNIKSCEVEKTHHATTIEELKKSGLR